MIVIREPLFHPINQTDWPRAQSFYYYTRMAPTTYTVNMMMDVSRLRRVLKEAGIKFFPAYLYLTTKAICNQQELRIAVQDETLGYWDTLTPAYPQFHEDDKTTSLLWTEYHDTFQTFYHNYLNDTAVYGKDHGILTTKGMPPANTYMISCIPWFVFQSFSLHNHGIKDYYVPTVEAGKFIEDGCNIRMPLSVTVHHATTDGYHLKVFFEDLQEDMNSPEKWL